MNTLLQFSLAHLIIKSKNGLELNLFSKSHEFQKKNIFFSREKKKTFQGNYIIFWKGVFHGKIPWVLENHYHEDKSHGFFGKPIQE